VRRFWWSSASLPWMCDPLETSKGLGVFACEACEAGRWICNYEGELLTEEEFQARRLRGPCDYVFETCDSGLCIDGEHSGHWSGRLNHDAPWACNCYVLYETVADRPVVRIHTKRSIAPGDELTIDYGGSYWLAPQRGDACALHYRPSRGAGLVLEREPWWRSV
jgi:SET domain-containing protein